MDNLTGGAGKSADKVIIAVSFMALILIVGGYYFRDTLFPDPATNPDAHFKDCKLLAENCIDVAICPMNVYCADGYLSDCRIYDCTEYYGVASTDAAGQISFKEETKSNESKTEDVRQSCRGQMEILSQQCVEEKTEIDVRLITQGECPVENFAVIFQDIGVVNSEFVSKEGGIYAIRADYCGVLDSIIPAAEGGIGLEYGQNGN